MWQKFNNDPVCFEARDNQYGAFNVTKTGLVKAMKLVHRSGSIECNPTDPSTFWSCSYVNLYPKNSFMTIITNSNREALLPPQEKLQLGQCSTKHYYLLEGVNQGSPELILGNLSRPLRLLKDQQLQIWYGQDWVDCSEYNNNGTTCVDIFAWYEWDWQHGFTITLRKIGAALWLKLAFTSCLGSKMYLKVPLRSNFYEGAFFETLYWAYLPVPTAFRSEP